MRNHEENKMAEPAVPIVIGETVRPRILIDFSVNQGVMGQGNPENLWGAMIAHGPISPAWRSAVRARAIADPAAAARVGIAGGQHTQQGRTTARSG
jgi:hypothetical protein